MQQVRNTAKARRLEAILNIVRFVKVDNQEAMLRLLSERGYAVTQATLSRDFAELKIVKVPDSQGGYRYMPHPDDSSGQSSPSGLVSIEVSGQMAVIRTRPGYANVLAANIDDTRLTNVMGTVAGDDTVLVVLRAGIDKTLFVDELSTIMPDARQKLI
ncbi:MAG: hypothetical protein II375_05435 [Bacteroidales bacterium]|nr:hypothetical protein [Bacteroidales bacterium]